MKLNYHGLTLIICVKNPQLFDMHAFDWIKLISLCWPMKWCQIVNLIKKWCWHGFGWSGTSCKNSWGLIFMVSFVIHFCNLGAILLISRRPFKGRIISQHSCFQWCFIIYAVRLWSASVTRFLSLPQNYFKGISFTFAGIRNYDISTGSLFSSCLRNDWKFWQCFETLEW